MNQACTKPKQNIFKIIKDNTLELIQRGNFEKKRKPLQSLKK